MLRITDASIYPARKPSFLANAKVTLSDDSDNSITITDLRVLKNKQNETWIALPNYCVPDGKSWTYESTVILSRKLQFEISEAVLAAYAKWTAPIAPNAGVRQ
jgi:DNA-binding cell septation regulator SpoVG